MKMKLFYTKDKYLAEGYLSIEDIQKLTGLSISAIFVRLKGIRIDARLKNSTNYSNLYSRALCDELFCWEQLVDGKWIGIGLETPTDPILSRKQIFEIYTFDRHFVESHCGGKNFKPKYRYGKVYYYSLESVNRWFAHQPDDCVNVKELMRIYGISQSRVSQIFSKKKVRPFGKFIFDNRYVDSYKKVVVIPIFDEVQQNKAKLLYTSTTNKRLLEQKKTAVKVKDTKIDSAVISRKINQLNSNDRQYYTVEELAVFLKLDQDFLSELVCDMPYRRVDNGGKEYDLVNIRKLLSMAKYGVDPANLGPRLEAKYRKKIAAREILYSGKQGFVKEGKRIQITVGQTKTVGIVNDCCNALGHLLLANGTLYPFAPDCLIEEVPETVPLSDGETFRRKRNMESWIKLED